MILTKKILTKYNRQNEMSKISKRNVQKKSGMVSHFWLEKNIKTKDSLMID